MIPNDSFRKKIVRTAGAESHRGQVLIEGIYITVDLLHDNNKYNATLTAKSGQSMCLIIIIIIIKFTST